MQISRFSAENYKSIRSVSETELTNGFNIVTGQNASGKTALLELLALGFGSKPHRSQETVRNKRDVTDGKSEITVSLEISSNELISILRNNREIRFVPLPPVNSSLARESMISQWDANTAQRFIEHFLNRSKQSFELRFVNGAPNLPPKRRSSLENHPLELRPAELLAGRFQMELDGQLTQANAQWITIEPSSTVDLGINLTPHLRSFVYRFNPDRAPLARCPHGNNSQLNTSANNLAEVLNILQGNAAAFEEFVNLASEVLPQVRWLSVRPVPQGNEIGVWSHDRRTKREDLAVPLDETGTGVGQVLAILYVVFSSDEARVIIIDEPQSFLHPSSAIKLIEILKRYPQHQFILATHSPSIIAAAKPKNILMLRYENEETKLEVFDLHKATSFSNFLNAAGLHLQDVFGADSILWVEGPTEEQVFPDIIEKLTDISLMGTTIKPVKATGDLEGRDAKRIFEMYRTLTKGNALLSPVLAFILDREARNDQEQKEMIQLSGGTAIFLKRRMFENYLLNPTAIAAFINTVEGFRPTPVTPEEITKQLEQKKSDKKYFHPMAVQQDWIKDINAAKVLADVFGELSERRVEYRKPDHSVLIARWILENTPEEFTEVADTLRQVFEKRPLVAVAN